MLGQRRYPLPPYSFNLKPGNDVGIETLSAAAAYVVYVCVFVGPMPVGVLLMSL